MNLWKDHYRTTASLCASMRAATAAAATQRECRLASVSGHLPGLEVLGRVAPGMASCISCERGG